LRGGGCSCRDQRGRGRSCRDRGGRGRGGRERRPVIRGMASRALPAIVAGRARVAGIAQGITGVVELDLGPGIDNVAVRALPGPVPAGGCMAGNAVDRPGVVVGHHFPVRRAGMAVAAGSGEVCSWRLVTGTTIRQAQVREIHHTPGLRDMAV
jgi:hypothetical protein